MVICMKNFIFNNYGIYPKKLYCLNDKNLYFFDQNDVYYIFVMNQNDIHENVIQVYYELIEEINTKNKKIRINGIVKNKNNELYCKKNNKKIILFRRQSCDSICDVTKYINDYEYLNVLNLDALDMKEKVEREIDEVEMLILDNDNENLLVRKSYNYFIGMAENAVQLLSEYNRNDEKYLGISENVLDFKDHYYFNAFDLFRTNKYYNIALEIKKMVLLRQINYDAIDKIICDISENDMIFMFSIFLYPIEFFDIVKLLFNCENDSLRVGYDKVVKIIINNVDYYLDFLKYVRNKCIKNEKIELINWI